MVLICTNTGEEGRKRQHTNVWHIEVQVMTDRSANVLHHHSVEICAFFPRSHPWVQTNPQGREGPCLVKKEERYVITLCRTVRKAEEGTPQIVLLPLLSFIVRRLWSADNLSIHPMVEGPTENKLWL